MYKFDFMKVPYHKFDFMKVHYHNVDCVCVPVSIVHVCKNAETSSVNQEVFFLNTCISWYLNSLGICIYSDDISFGSVSSKDIGFLS